MISDQLRQRLSIPFFFADMVLFGVAIGFLDTSTVIPEFVGQATDSKVLVGLSGILFGLAWRLPQLAAAPAANRATRKRRFMLTFALPSRSMFFWIGIAAMLIGGNKSAWGWMLAIFFAGYALFAILDGITSLAWVELIGSAVPDTTRGIMLSASQVVGGILILGVQDVLRRLLGPGGPGFPFNYATVFLIAATLFTFSTFFLTNVYEKKSTSKARTIELKDYLPYLKQIAWKDKPFRNFLIMRFFMETAFYMVSPFYIGFETEQLGIASAQAVSDSLVAVTIGSIGSSFLFGWLSTRFSPRIIIWAMIAAVIAGPLLVLASPLIGYPALLIAFGTIGLAHAGGAPGILNWLIAYPEPGNRPIYSGIANTVGILALLAPVIGGALLQASGYTFLYGTAFVLAVIAALAATRLITPRGTGSISDL